MTTATVWTAPKLAITPWDRELGLDGRGPGQPCWGVRLRGVRCAECQCEGVGWPCGGVVGGRGVRSGEGGGGGKD